jgi:hypothetical protein
MPFDRVSVRVAIAAAALLLVTPGACGGGAGSTNGGTGGQSPGTGGRGGRTGTGGAGAGTGGAGSVTPDGGGSPGNKRGRISILEGRLYFEDLDRVVEEPRSAIEARFFQGAEPAWHHEAMNDGTCRLLTFSPVSCDPFCNGICLPGNACEPWPSYISAGTLTLTGLKVAAISLTPQGDSAYYGLPAAPPLELFDAGSTVTVSAAGGTLPAFTAQARGVARLETAIQNGRFALVNGQDYTLRWTPAGGDDTRVRLTINSRNNGHGQPYNAIIECDAPDATGQLTIPHAMIDGLPEIHAFIGCVSIDCPPSFLLRYTRAVAELPGDTGHVDVIVGDRSIIGVDHRP